jgi:phasin
MASGPRKTKTAETSVEAAVETLKAASPAENVETISAVEPVVAEVKKAQASVQKAAAETASSLEESFGAASKSLQVFSAKALEAYQANAAASVQYVQALSGVRSVSEAIALQSEHMRKQYEALTAQAKELSALAQQVAADAAAPLKDQFGKAFNKK